MVYNYIGGSMKNYALKFKEDYKFLEDYGFCFTVDPHNSNRPCYKNRYGEIILWVDSVSSFIYIQINGWRKDVNVKEDYKSIFKKSTLKPLHIMFKELFIYLVKTTGKFYDLEVIPNDKYKLDEISLEQFNASINPITVSKTNRMIWIPTVLLILFIPGIISIKYVKDISIYNGIVVTMFLLMFVINLFITIPWRKKYGIISLLLMYTYPIMCIYLIYNETRRTDYICYQVYFWICLLCFIIYLFRYIFNRNKDFILNAILVLFFPFLVLVIKSFELQDFMFFEETFNIVFLIVSIVLTLISSGLYLVFRKDRKQKGYVGALFGVMILVFFSSFITPIFTVNTINYSFDTSSCEKYNYQIVDRYIRHIRRSSGYYIVILKDGKEEKLSVSSFTYYDYEDESYISLYYYEGFLGYSYYELKDIS